MKDKYTLLIFLFISAFCKTGSDSYAADIVISEILAANNTTNYDEYYYNFGDWIEFYNSSASPKNLQGYFLTDDPDNLFKYQITDYFAINPGSQRIFWADEYDSYIHTNFSIDNEGEFIALIDPSGNIVDSLTLPPQFPDVSFGRSPVNSQNWQYFDHPTPGSSNGSGIDNAIFSGEVIFSLEPGFYSGSIVVELSTNQSVEEIRYTLDGSFPAEYSTLYAGPISISKNRVLRARSFTDQMLPSPIKSHSFFIGEDSLTLPAISISTASAYLEDPMIGIYVEGENGKIDNCIDSAMNFNQDWERAVNFEYFLPSGEQVINQVVGVKINGGCSRNVPSKSFAVYARKKYGKNRMEYPFFKNKNIIEYKNLILRNAGNDYYYAYMRDGFMQTLVADVTAIDYQSYQPARIYINGKYWGILNMREKQNEHYLAANHNVDPDRVDLIESNSVVIEGSDEHYVAMMDFLRSHDITDSVNYAYMCSQMDMDQFIDYYIAQIYFENEDWPMHNIKCWRPQTEGAKWRWLLYDTDYGFGRWPRTGNTVNWAFMKDWEPTMLGATLVENEAFRDEFCQRFAARLSTSYSIPRVLHILDSLRSNIDTEMHLHIEKWGSPWAHWHWIDNTQVMDEFALGRGSLMYQQVNDKFHLEGTASLVLSSSDFSAGQPEIHDIPIDSTTSTTVFRNVPIRMQATPKPGYAFSHWSGASTSLDPFLTLSLADSDTLIAHFKEAPPVENLFINELSSRSENGIPDEYGEPEDWIELYNGNSEPLYLDNLFLTDSIQDPLKHKITDDRSNLIIQPGEYLILFADGDTHQGIRHLNFKLSNQGETIALVQKIGIRRNHIIDSVSFRKQGTGATYGRSPIDPDRFQFLIPTPGSQNDEKTIDNILINEFVSSNRSGAKDNHGEYEDWIELYNSGEEVVSVSGMFITDSLPDRTRYQIPFVENDSLSLNPGEHLLLWADNQPEQGCRHLGFRLSGSGESIALVQPNGFDFIDSLSYGDIRQDVAMGCLPDGSSSFQLVTPTPGDTNTVNLLDSIFINELVASNRNSGQDEYEETDDWIELYNGNNLPVDVGGLYITDSVPATIKCRIPSYCPDSTTIPAKGFLRFWADNSPEQGILHLNFKLSNKGERLGLVQQNGIDFIDSLEYPELAKDAAWGRIPDGSSGIQLVSASPLEPNRVDTLSNLFINEIMSSNTYTIQDEFAEYDDWIELYNANSFPVDIGGLYLTDSLGNHIKQRISEDSSALTTIAARGHLILWADNQPEQGILHLNFKLSNAGEDIGLFLEDGLTSVDSLVYHENNADASLGRFPDGSDTLEYMLPTPGTENLRNVIENVLISELASSTNHLFPDEYGELNDWIELYNNNPWPVSIGGLYLTDSLNFPRKYRIPNRSPDSTTIPAKGRLILWADNQVDQGILHLDFALSGKGEELALVNTDGKRILDALSFPDQYPDISYGRENDTLQWKAMRPTPGEPNINEDFQGIMISEIAADNENRFPDEYGNFSDWIEIYNPNSYPVDMGGCFLTDSLGNPVKFRIPADNPDKTTIPANNYLILFADDSTSLGPLHTNFKLSRQGEKLGLYHFNTTKRLDYLTFGEQYKNFAFARELSSGQWINMPPTPKAPNKLPDLSGLFINEIMPDNDSWIADDKGEYEDWLELYNAGEQKLDVGGLFLTDSIENKTKERISSLYPDSTTIPPGGFLLLWADKDKEQGILHLGFKLSKDGEELALFNYDGKLIDQVSYTVPNGLSYGRIENGNSAWTWFNYPTPDASNVFSPLQDYMPDEFSLMVYPNPMTDYIRFEFMLSRPEPVSLRIYHISGSLVYVQQFTPNGNALEVEWNGIFDGGQMLGPGLYVYQAAIGGKIVTGRFVKE